MSDYAIGDVQGCYEPLMRLLEHIAFNDREDRLWFVGDLVNRGPQSLNVLRFVKDLPLKPHISLGNHDLHLLSSLFAGQPWQGHDDTIHDILEAPDGYELGHWLRQQSIIYYCPVTHFVLCHAGIPPIWDLEQAIAHAQELEAVLRGEHFVAFLKAMYGNAPRLWSDELSGIERLRLITNYFTRMRFCTRDGGLDLSYKGAIKDCPEHSAPWFALPQRKEINADILFGHWAALRGECSVPRIHALDTGCLWGGQLTALRLQDKLRFSVPGVLT